MKRTLSAGQTYINSEGDTYELVGVSKARVTLESSNDELLVADMEEFLRDLDSGEFELFDGDSEA